MARISGQKEELPWRTNWNILPENWRSNVAGGLWQGTVYREGVVLTFIKELLFNKFI